MYTFSVPPMLHAPSTHPSPNRYSDYYPGRTGRLPARITNFVFSKTFRLALPPAQTAIQWAMEVLCPGWRRGRGKKWQGRESVKYAPPMIRLRILLPLHAFNGPGSSVSIGIGYRLDGPEIESRWRRDFPHLSRPAVGPTQPPVQ